jgi:hypothetical protein
MTIKIKISVGMIFGFFVYLLNKMVEIVLIKLNIEAVKNAKLVKKIINITMIVNISRIPKFSSKPLIKISSPATRKITSIIFKSFLIPY